MEAQPEARPILRGLFALHAEWDLIAQVPGAGMVAAAPAMAAMHQALERGDSAEALAHLKVWAQSLGVIEGEAAPG